MFDRDFIAQRLKEDKKLLTRMFKAAAEKVSQIPDDDYDKTGLQRVCEIIEEGGQYFVTVRDRVLLQMLIDEPSIKKARNLTQRDFDIAVLEFSRRHNIVYQLLKDYNYSEFEDEIWRTESTKKLIEFLQKFAKFAGDKPPRYSAPKKAEMIAEHTGLWIAPR